MPDIVARLRPTAGSELSPGVRWPPRAVASIRACCSQQFGSSIHKTAVNVVFNVEMGWQEQGTRAHAGRCHRRLPTSPAAQRRAGRLARPQQPAPFLFQAIFILLPVTD